MNHSPNCMFCGPRLNSIQMRLAHLLNKKKPSSESQQTTDAIEHISIATKCPFRSTALFSKKGIVCKKQKGFTALELIVVLVVGMGIIALAASKMDLLFGRANVFEEISNLNILFTNIKSLKTSSGYGVANTNLVPQLIKTKGIPQNMSVVSQVPYNIWGGAVAVASTGAGFSISYSSVPQEACIKLATQANRGGVFESAKVNSATAVIGEYPSAQASADCSSSLANRLTWTASS